MYSLEYDESIEKYNLYCTVTVMFFLSFCRQGRNPLKFTIQLIETKVFVKIKQKASGERSILTLAEK